MRIIAKTKGGYLLEATGSDIANVMGISSVSGLPRAMVADESRYERILEIGTEINVSDMFKHITELEAQKKSLESTARSLRAAAVLIERIPARITPSETLEGGPDAA